MSTTRSFGILRSISLGGTIVSALMLVATMAGLLPSWAIALVPFWIVALCYFNLDGLVRLGIGPADGRHSAPVAPFRPARRR